MSAQPIGVPPSRRFVIQNLDDAKVWNGKAFVEDWDEARKYATASDACFDMADIQRDFYGALPRRRFVCPVEIEVYGKITRTKLARYLHRATTLNVKTHEYGNGPGETLVLPVIHFGLVREIEDVPMLSKVDNWDEEDEFGLEDDDEN
ncbi:hypothetical protein [Thalassoglobus neptunius]|uniref:hypothetical protein n=1 Tax=Thalassoglobus neptunius TaxID=1938619 RepID=UPI0018D25625|nr:hypothetical protein [Thalassoglobus neptunius]